MPCLPPGDLPNQGIEPLSLASPALAGRFFTTSATWEAPCLVLNPARLSCLRTFASVGLFGWNTLPLCPTAAFFLFFFLMAALGLHCDKWVFSSYNEQGPFFLQCKSFSLQWLLFVVPRL